MTKDQAFRCMAEITQVGFGWTNENTAAYVDRLMEFTNFTAALEACRRLAFDWNKPTRIPLGTIRDTYEQVLRAFEDQEPPERELNERIPTIVEGRKIAAKAYLEDCKLIGKEPNWPFFEKVFGVVAKDYK